MSNTNGKNGRDSLDELDNSAQGLLRRLNNQYDASRIEAEKNRMENIEKNTADDEDDVIDGDIGEDIVIGDDDIAETADDGATGAEDTADAPEADDDDFNALFFGNEKEDAPEAPVPEKEETDESEPAEEYDDDPVNMLLSKYNSSQNISDDRGAEKLNSFIDSLETKAGAAPEDKKEADNSFTAESSYEQLSMEPVDEPADTAEAEESTGDSLGDTKAQLEHRYPRDARVAKPDPYKPVSLTTAEDNEPDDTEDEALSDEEIPDRLKEGEDISDYEPSKSMDTGVTPAVPSGDNNDTGDSTPENADDPYMQTDTAIMAAFGHAPSKQVEKNTKKIFNEYTFSNTEELYATGEDEEKPKKAESPNEPRRAPRKSKYEFTSTSQNREIIGAYRSKYSSVQLRMVFCGLIAVILLLLENIASLRNMILPVSLYYIVADLALAFISVLLVSKSLSNAISSIFKFKLDVDSVTLIFAVASLITTLVTLTGSLEDPYTEFAVYNFPLALCVFMNLICEFFNIRRDIYSFKIVSSGKDKRILSCMTRAERASEEIEFSDYLGDGSEIYKVRKTQFVSDFFARKAEFPRAKAGLKYFIPAIVLVSVCFFVLSFFYGDHSLYESFNIGYLAFLMCAPVSMMISFSYPAYLSAIKAYSYDAAIVGDTSPEEYEKAAVVVFSDKDAFPADKVKIKSVKVFANNPIENVIYYASSVFSKLGGPLETVFSKATLNSRNSDNVEIKEISDTGVDAFVDGKRIVLGQPEYMENQCFETVFEPGDELYEGKSNKRILYLASDSAIIAKFYIQYNTTSDFLYIVRNLYRQGICVSVHSCDPCIGNDILYSNKLDPTEYSIRIIKGRLDDIEEDDVSAFTGSIVSVGSLKGLVKTLIICDKLSNTAKTNMIVKVVSAVIGAGIMAAVFIAGASGSMLSVFPALYQLFWMIPIFFVSKIYV